METKETSIGKINQKVKQKVFRILHNIRSHIGTDVLTQTVTDKVIWIERITSGAGVGSKAAQRASRCAWMEQDG